MSKPNYRALILDILREQSRPLTSYEIYQYLKWHHRLILVSGYVHYYTEKLEAQGLVRVDRTNPKLFTFVAVEESGVSA